MKHLRHIIIASSLVLPLVGQAAPITLAQVQAELIAAEQAGQYPQSKTRYPEAQPSAATIYVANKAARDSAYGQPMPGGSDSGSHVASSGIINGGNPLLNKLHKGH
ncbi:DUF4148 domain-containing protein [Paraburkholderia sp. SIMBA_054]|uniref:DUF4148 domain-containing protein n=1 Tax=Paraburkholderia sp. SIMBA_054 TaxID=3085795 RepID=UPI003978D2DB